MRRYLFTAIIVAIVERRRPNTNTAPSTINNLSISNNWTKPSSQSCN